MTFMRPPRGIKPGSPQMGIVPSMVGMPGQAPGFRSEPNDNPLISGGSPMLSIFSPERFWAVDCHAMRIFAGTMPTVATGQAAYCTIVSVSPEDVGDEFCVVGYDLSVKSSDNAGVSGAEAVRGGVPWGNYFGENACIAMGLRSDMPWLAALNRWSAGPDFFSILGRSASADPDTFNLGLRGPRTIVARAFPPGRLNGFGEGELAPCRVDNWTSRDMPCCIRVPENNAYVVAIVHNGDDYTANIKDSSEPSLACSIFGQLQLAIQSTPSSFQS